jgi:hypothetical protein
MPRWRARTAWPASWYATTSLAGQGTRSQGRFGLLGELGGKARFPGRREPVSGRGPVGKFRGEVVRRTGRSMELPSRTSSISPDSEFWPVRDHGSDPIQRILQEAVGSGRLSVRDSVLCRMTRTDSSGVALVFRILSDLIGWGYRGVGWRPANVVYPYPVRQPRVNDGGVFRQAASTSGCSQRCSQRGSRARTRSTAGL